MVGHGVTSVSEVRSHLKVYVDMQMFPSADKPSLTDAAYYPSDVAIRKTHLLSTTSREVFQKRSGKSNEIGESMA